MDSLIEQIREEAVDDLFRIAAFKSGWPKRAKFLLGKLPQNGTITARSLIGLGEHLSPTFKLMGSKNRSQGALSSSGAVWEGIVVWYLNLCLAGTKAVCVRGGSLCPQPIKDALSILHENTVLRSEPDVLILSSEHLRVSPRTEGRKSALELASQIVGSNFSSLGIINIQCKTNWNDNAQTPMLWNMLYNQARKGAVISNGFNIGYKGFSLMNLGHFGYAFATVPTQTKGPYGYKSTSLEVLRVKSMTAGNYWGYPTVNSVCASISELFTFFTRNHLVFPNVAEIGVQAANSLSSSSPSGLTPSKLLLPS